MSQDGATESVPAAPSEPAISSEHRHSRDPTQSHEHSHDCEHRSSPTPPSETESPATAAEAICHRVKRLQDTREQTHYLFDRGLGEFISSFELLSSSTDSVGHAAEAVTEVASPATPVTSVADPGPDDLTLRQSAGGAPAPSKSGVSAAAAPGPARIGDAPSCGRSHAEAGRRAFEDYRALAHEVTETFKELSQEAVASKAECVELGRADLAEIIAALQKAEQRRLRATSKLHIFKEQVASGKLAVKEPGITPEEILDRLGDLKREVAKHAQAAADAVAELNFELG